MLQIRGENYFFPLHFTAFLTKIHRQTSTPVVQEKWDIFKIQGPTVIQKLVNPGG